MKDSSCQVSSLIGLILTQCAGDIFMDAKVLGAEFGGMSKTVSGQLGKVEGPPVLMINKGPGYSPTEHAVVGEQVGQMILAFVLVLNRLRRGGALPGCEGVWENYPSG